MSASGFAIQYQTCPKVEIKLSVGTSVRNGSAEHFSPSGNRPSAANGSAIAKRQFDVAEKYAPQLSTLDFQVRETLSVAMRVSNEDRSPARMHGGEAAPTPTGFAEIVGDYLPLLHAMDCASFALPEQ
jgi:hypothetical protein